MKFKSDLKEFVCYWILFFTEADDRRGKIASLCLFLLWFVAKVSKPLGFNFSENFTGYVEIASLAVAAIIGVLWLPFKRHQRVSEEFTKLKEKLSPKLKVECSSGEPRCRVETGGVLYLRAIVTNEGRVPLTGCKAYMTGVKKQGVPLEWRETRTLTFYPGHTTGDTPQTLPNKIPKALDVFVVNGMLQVFTATPRPPTLEKTSNENPLFSIGNSYEVSVLLSSNECGSMELSFLLTLGTTWAQTTLELIEVR